MKRMKGNNVPYFNADWFFDEGTSAGILQINMTACKSSNTIPYLEFQMLLPCKETPATRRVCLPLTQANAG